MLFIFSVEFFTDNGKSEADCKELRQKDKWETAGSGIKWFILHTAVSISTFITFSQKKCNFVYRLVDLWCFGVFTYRILAADFK